jgi:hypothetical protein
MSAWSVFADAIKKRAPVRFTYRGTQRVACPHKLGSDQSGRGKVLVCLGGGTRKGWLGRGGSADDWRCMFVDLVSNATIIEGDFVTPGNYKSGAPTCMAHVFLSVAGGKVSLGFTEKPKASRRRRQKRPIRWKMK